MGKLAGSVAVMLTIVGTLLLMGLAVGAWQAMFEGASWAGVGPLVIPTIAALALGALFERGAKSAGWDVTTWKPVDPRAPSSTTNSSQGHGSAEPDGARVLAMDGFLASYGSVDVDWRRRWDEAHATAASIPPFEHRPYWSPIGPHGELVPITHLAFYGVDHRRRMSMDSSTPQELRDLMKNDPDPGVRANASRTL
ncbi:MAG: hypothetical protein RJQ01_06700 [Microcella sp.]|uniref:hypothetical protein n=1 Tax=Microcella sp. TaxID=1913979 RepID=UPI00331624CE